jgi:hypothetical protein
MRRFLINSAIFILIGALLFHIKPLYLLYKERYKAVVSGDEIYYSITKSKSKNKSKKLLLGDSVARQLFDNKKDHGSVNSLACNQSIAMVGHYILLNDYLEAGNEVDTVFLLFRPFTFQNNLDQVYTYHYFLKPFYTSEYKPYFSGTVNEQISKIPYRQFCRYPSILTSNWAPNFRSHDKASYTFLSPISVEYLKKMKELSLKRNFKLIILPTPLMASLKKSVDSLDKNEIAKTGLQEEFSHYFDNILYLDDSNFSDGSHLKDPAKYSEYYKNKFLEPGR